MSDSTATGSVTKRNSAPLAGSDLTPGKPWRDTKGPEGASFDGWVLVQLWSPTTNSSGVTVHWSGDKTALFDRAAAELNKLKDV